MREIKIEDHLQVFSVQSSRGFPYFSVFLAK